MGTDFDCGCRVSGAWYLCDKHESKLIGLITGEESGESNDIIENIIKTKSKEDKMPFKSDEQRKAFFAKQGNVRSSVKPQILGKMDVKKPKSNVPDFVNNKTLTEKEIKLLQRRLNDGKITQREIFGQDGKSFRLTPEQTAKGLKFLNNQRRSPKGVERENNPFGFREEAVLDNFDKFEVRDFFDAGTVSFKSHVPLFRVVAKDGSTFDYTFSGGQVTIRG